MDAHAKRADDLPGTLGLLQEINDTAEIRAGGKPWFVLIERQPLDDASWNKGSDFQHTARVCLQHLLHHERQGSAPH